MSYMHIDNLYKSNDILLFKECYATEKIHGSHARVGYNPKENKINFFSGGATHEKFVELFNEQELIEKFKTISSEFSVGIFGEAYGGKMQGMSFLYGKQLKFCAFEVKIGESWLAVPQAEEIVVKTLGLEFVAYEKIPTTLEALNKCRDADSVQAVRNGVDLTKLPEGKTPMREGIVLHPLIEVKKNNGERIIAKYKNEAFEERKTNIRPDISPEELKILDDANAIANEWVTPMRFEHVISKLPQDKIGDMSCIPLLMKAMIEDITREGRNEIVDSKQTRKMIGKKTVELFTASLKGKLEEAAK